ncbi:MAG: leucyl aminopeptidase, partial [Gammaproteobacteria bacterium]
QSASVALLDTLPADIHPELGSQWMTELVGDVMYRFTQCKSETTKQPSLRKLVIHAEGVRQKRAVESGARQGLALNEGKDLARDLANLPGNICTPSYLASQARKLARQYTKISVSIMEEAAMRRQGMGALLSVAAGSRQPAKLITLQYKNHRSAKPVVLVGKGVTFDSGGISIKPSAAMDEMKYDMCGAASVLGTFHAVAMLGLPINLVGIIPSTENLPDGAASKPGDIVTSLSGQTIEILNTDAEGRLILCDALTYAARFKPKAVIDIATLTGACVIALGSHPSGLLGNHSKLISHLREAGDVSGDRVWELPLWDDYQDQLKSPFADMANVGGREAGTITAGCFLSRFTEAYHWAHLDIAGTAWKSGTNKGATGRPVPLLLEYLKKHG